jgi:hypothetical protein
MTATIAIGVDPGLSGAIACYCSRRGLLEWTSFPTMAIDAGPTAKVRRRADARALRRLVAGWSVRHRFTGNDHVVGVIERMSSHGAKDTVPPAVLLSMGYTAGVAEGVLAAFTTEFLRPLPQQWKNGYGLKREHRGPGAETSAQFKARSVRLAQRFFPQIGRVSDDVAEAILLAFYGAGLSLPLIRAEHDEDDPMAMPA